MNKETLLNIINSNNEDDVVLGQELLCNLMDTNPGLVTEILQDSEWRVRTYISKNNRCVVKHPKLNKMFEYHYEYPSDFHPCPELNFLKIYNE